MANVVLSVSSCVLPHPSNPDGPPTDRPIYLPTLPDTLTYSTCVSAGHVAGVVWCLGYLSHSCYLCLCASCAVCLVLWCGVNDMTDWMDGTECIACTACRAKKTDRQRGGLIEAWPRSNQKLPIPSLPTHLTRPPTQDKTRQ